MCFVTKNDLKSCYFIKKQIKLIKKRIKDECPLKSESLIAYFAHLLLKAVNIMHKNGVIHGNVSEDTLFFRNILALPDRKMF